VPGAAVVEVEHGTPAAGAALEAVPDGAVGPVQAVAVAGDREPPDRLPAGQRRVRGELEQLVARTRAGLGPHPLDPLGLGGARGDLAVVLQREPGVRPRTPQR